jgi:hypothetical protein
MQNGPERSGPFLFGDAARYAVDRELASPSLPQFGGSRLMRCERLQAPEEWNDVRGPNLVRWLTDADMRFPEVGEDYKGLDGSIVGAVSDDHWVIFHRLQVIQIVPDEVHSGWHYEFMDEAHKPGSAWHIINSEWIETFHPRHLADHGHFIIRFYDEVVELICRDLLFGRVPFDLAPAISAFPELGYAYVDRAFCQEKQGDKEGAIASFERYLQLQPDSRSAEYMRRNIIRLRQK